MTTPSNPQSGFTPTPDTSIDNRSDQPTPTTAPSPLLPEDKAIPAWRFAVPLLLQIVLILSVPAQAIYTQLTGTTVLLQTAPVDPYNLFHGYSVRLNYDISNPEHLKTLPGWDRLTTASGDPAPGTQFYLVLAAPQSPTKPAYAPWQPVRISRDRPSNLAENQVALQGLIRNSFTVDYGLETYYIPEEQRAEINQALSRQAGEQTQPTVVEVKVDSQGNAVPLSIWVRDASSQDPSAVRQYRF